MTRIAEIDTREITVTPVFMVKEVENIPQSEAAGYPVMEMIEGVEVRFAGSKTYSPFFRANDFSHREGNHVVTYAERWPDQYRAFKEGSPQEARGTPLQMLAQFGVTPEQMSLCRALKVYSIEALHHLEGQNLKNLGMNGNALKAAAARFMAQRETSEGAFAELEMLRKRVAELEERSTVPPVQEATPTEVEIALMRASGFDPDAASDADLKDRLAEITGERPRGNPSRATLLSMLKGLEPA